MLQAVEGAGSGQGAGDKGERAIPSSWKFSQLKERARRKMRRNQQKGPRSSQCNRKNPSELSGFPRCSWAWKSQPADGPWATEGTGRTKAGCYTERWEKTQRAAPLQGTDVRKLTGRGGGPRARADLGTRRGRVAPEATSMLQVCRVVCQQSPSETRILQEAEDAGFFQNMVSQYFLHLFPLVQVTASFNLNQLFS